MIIESNKKLFFLLKQSCEFFVVSSLVLCVWFTKTYSSHVEGALCDSRLSICPLIERVNLYPSINLIYRSSLESVIQPASLAPLHPSIQPFFSSHHLLILCFVISIYIKTFREVFLCKYWFTFKFGKFSKMPEKTFESFAIDRSLSKIWFFIEDFSWSLLGEDFYRSLLKVFSISQEVYMGYFCNWLFDFSREDFSRSLPSEKIYRSLFS